MAESINAVPDRIREAIRDIYRGFTWDSTPQGTEYWYGVCKALKELLEIAEKEQHAPTVGAGHAD